MVYKPTYIWGAPSCIYLDRFSVANVVLLVRATSHPDDQTSAAVLDFQGSSGLRPLHRCAWQRARGKRVLKLAAGLMYFRFLWFALIQWDDDTFWQSPEWFSTTQTTT